MNAIILAAGHGMRMKRNEVSIHKPLLPINNIPNIERTIILLNDYGIKDIIIICGIYYKLYQYLEEQYSCQLITEKNTSISTLYGINAVLDKLGDTFIIEGDVVLTHNIFMSKSYSFYYTIQYPSKEDDSWCPITDKSGRIISFEIGPTDKPCIFGISFWSMKDNSFIKQFLKATYTVDRLENGENFWDDYFVDILAVISIYTEELSADTAIEMNNLEEYITALQLCENYYANVDNYFLNLPSCNICSSEISLYHFIKDDVLANYYIKKLLKYYNEKHPNNIQDLVLPIEILSNEYFYIIHNNVQSIGFINLVIEKNYILLRRIYIDSTFRSQTLGSSIVKKISTYAMLINKELRVNVYDGLAEKFYLKLGFGLNFKNYIYLYNKGNYYENTF